MKQFLLILMTCALALGLYAQIPAGDAQPCSGTPTVTDIDGNVYNTVKIGYQCWMKENLRVTKMPDGRTISRGSSPNPNALRYYNYSSSSIPLAERGYLYNFRTAADYSGSYMSNDVYTDTVEHQGVCPLGWHLPNIPDFEALSNYVLSKSEYLCDGTFTKALASTSWNSSLNNTGECSPGNQSVYPNNKTGFNAYPAGEFFYAGDEDPEGGGLGDYGYRGTGLYTSFWTCVRSVDGPFAFSLTNDSYYDEADALLPMFDYMGEGMGSALSVRCLRNTIPTVTTGEVIGLTVGGNVLYDGGFEVTARGVCWSTEHNPTIADPHTNEGTGLGTFTSLLSAMSPNTTYYVRAYATNSRGTAYGSEKILTTLQCSSIPTNVTVSDITAGSARIDWEGAGDRYLVYYRTPETPLTLFWEGFENGIPSTWTTLDQDGDGHNWFLNNYSSFSLSGSGNAASESFDMSTHEPITPDNWLITPKLNLQGTMKVWLKGMDPEADFLEHFAIYLSTTGNAVSDFTTTLVSESVTTNDYTEYSVDLSGYAGQQGYIAIRHFNCTGMNRLLVDDFSIGDTIPAGEWHTISSTNTTTTLSDLNPATQYEVQVQSICNNAPSERSSSANFNTNICYPDDQCELTFVLTDSYGDGWNGNAILVKDAELGVVLGTMANENLDSVNGAETQTVTLAVCDGRTVNFEWIEGQWAYETSYTVYDVRGEEIFSGSGGFSGTTYSYAVNCCDKIVLDGHDTFYDDFDGYTTSTAATTGVEPTCWKLVREDADMPDNKRPQLYYDSNNAHSGNYSLKLSNRGVYAMPKLDDNVNINELRLDMYVRQTSASYRLQVGVWESDGTFVPVATIKNSSTTEMEYVTCDFSSYTGSGRRIAFRNTVPGSNLAYSTHYIDDIVLRRLPANDGRPCPGVPTVTDIDGNVYNTVKLGEQCWMKENLRTTHFADGVEIPLSTYPDSHLPYRYIPNNDSTIVAEYGYLYNQSAAMHGAYQTDANPSGVQGICPDGWHLPSKTEWTQLTDYVNSQNEYGCGAGAASAKALAASTGWVYDATVQNQNDCGPAYLQGTNGATGFNALPAGEYYNYSRYFGYKAYFWTSSVYSYYNNASSLCYLLNTHPGAGISYDYNYYAVSVRCVLGEGGNVPVVTTGRIRAAGDSTMTCEGIVTADGGEDVIARGICWSSSIYASPTISGNHTEDGTGLGTFTGTLTGLTPGTKYYVRAYATNATGTAYGEQTFFITPNCRPVTYLPYYENFDRYTPSTTPATDVEPNCWELVQEDVAMTDATRPQLYYKSDFAHSGSYSLKLNNRGVYAMPDILEYFKIREIILEMYLRQPNALYQLEVGVWEDNGTFVPVKRFNNSSTELEFVECDFSSYMGSGGRIAFRNVLGGNSSIASSVNYIDDIRLTSACEGIVLPYAEDFESHTASTTAATGVEPLCWELVGEDAPMPDSKRPQIYYKSDFAHSGNYSLKLSNRGVYAMPYLSWNMEELTLDRVKLEMYVRQPNAAYQLEVGVWDEQEGFIPVQLVNNSTTDVEKVTVYFSDYRGRSRRIAFRNVLANGYNYDYSYNYIDDITLTEIPEVECGISELPYNENFDDYTSSTTTATGVEPTCWELVQSDVQMTDANRPQLCYNSSFAHSGDYSLKLYYRGVYAMPELELEPGDSIQQVKLEMYLRQANAKYQLQVGIWEENGTFVPVATFNNSTTGVEYVTCDFSGYRGQGGRIAFRNTLGSGTTAFSSNYLDDITLTKLADCSVSLPYTENFDNYTTVTATETGVEPRCWEVVTEDVALTNATRPQLYHGFSTSGDYSLRLKNRCVYAMPELAEDVNVNKLTMTFKLRQANAVYRLQVGVVEENGAFTVVKTINNATAEMEEVSVSFADYTGEGRRIAFRNTVKSSSTLAYSTNYIDDIVLDYSNACTIVELPYAENFDSYTTLTATETGVEPDCWEVVTEDVALTNATKPQLYRGFSTSGDYSLRLKNRCVYAMPALGEGIDIKGLEMSFKLRQANAVYRLQVGVVEENGAFTVVKTINNATADMEDVVVKFSGYTGSGKRIAFRNTVKSGSTLAYSTNYIDDIVLDYTCNIVELPYTEDFDSYTTVTATETGVEPDCWEVVTEDVALTNATKPQLYRGFSTSGDYSLRLKNRCVYAMPEFAEGVNVKELTMTFKLRQANAVYRLQVGVVEENGAFTAVKTINNATADMEEVTVSFAGYTGSGRRIAFRNTVKSSSTLAYSTNYIDDINITRTASTKSAEITDANAGMLGSERDMLDVVVYPNPTKDVVNVQCTMNNVQCSGIEVVDIYGKIITTVGTRFIASDQTPVQINVSGLAAGMYFVRVTTDKGIVTKPFVKR